MNFSEHFKPTEVCNKNTRVIKNKKNVKKLRRKSFNRSHCILDTNYFRNL